jgi:hypothetical protein
MYKTPMLNRSFQDKSITYQIIMPNTTLLKVAGYGSFLVAIKHAVSIEKTVYGKAIIISGHSNSPF